MRQAWQTLEVSDLINLYHKLTIQELQTHLKEVYDTNRSQDSINAKIKRLKKEGYIKGYREGDTVRRALRQRHAYNE